MAFGLSDGMLEKTSASFLKICTKDFIFCTKKE